MNFETFWIKNIKLDTSGPRIKLTYECTGDQNAAREYMRKWWNRVWESMYG